MNDQKKVNLLPDRRRDLQVGQNLLYQAIRPDLPYLGVHQGHQEVPSLSVPDRNLPDPEVLRDPSQILPDPEVLSDQAQVPISPDPEVLSDQVQVPISPDPVPPLDHRQLAQVPDPTHPERMTGFKKNCDINVQNPLDFLLFK